MVASSENNLLLGFRIGDFDVDPLGGTLTPVGDKPRHLEPKVMDVLVHLAKCSGQMVTRDRLLDLVWPGQVAADELLTRAISELRRAFDDGAKHPKYIVTVPKRGYRLIGDIVPRKGAEQAKTDEITGAGYSTTARKQAYVAAGVVALVIAYFTFDRILIDSSQSAKSELSETGSIGSALITASTAVRPRPLTSMEGFEREPALSPDGNYIAYTWLDRLITRHGVIYRQPVDGGTPNRLTDADESKHSPAWSPDGTRIAFI